MKKRCLAIMLGVVLTLISVLSPVQKKNVVAETEEEEHRYSFSPGIVTPFQLDEFYFDNIFFYYDGSISILKMNVTNLGDEMLVDECMFSLSIISHGEEMVELPGFIGGNIAPGETRILSSAIDIDILDAKFMVVSVNGREKNSLRINTNEGVTNHKTIDQSIVVSDICVYGYERWVFECNVRSTKRWYWNCKLHFRFKDEEGNVVAEFMEDLPKSFEISDSVDVVFQPDADLSKVSDIEIELVRKSSPKIERNDLLILHNNEAEKGVIVESVSAVREADCEWWDVSVDFYNSRMKEKRVYNKELDFINASDDWVGKYDKAGSLDLESGESCTYNVQVYKDIESMHSIQIITDVVTVASPSPTEQPEVTPSPSPLPTEQPEVTASPSPTEPPEVTVSPSPLPTEQPEVTASPSPTEPQEVTASPSPTEPPEVTASPGSAEQPEVTESPSTTERSAVVESPKPTKFPEKTLQAISVKGVKVERKGNSILVCWNRTKGVSKYMIYRSTKKNAGYKLIKEVEGKTKYLDQSVKKGKNYYYMVCAKGNEGSSMTVRVRIPYYVQPKIIVKNKSYSQSLNYVEITLKKHEGKFLQLYYKKGTGKFKRVLLRSNQLKKGKNIFRISYQKRIKTLYFKVRTYGNRGRKKYYSEFSQIAMIKNGK